LRGAGRADAALNEAIASVRLDPNLAGGYMAAALCLSELGRLAEAEQAWRRVVTLQPNNAEANGNLAATLEKLGVKGSALLVGAEKSPKLLLAAGNNPRLRAVESLGVNVYELLKHDQVVFSKEAVLALQEVVKP